MERTCLWKAAHVKRWQVVEIQLARSGPVILNCVIDLPPSAVPVIRQESWGSRVLELIARCGHEPSCPAGMPAMLTHAGAGLGLMAAWRLLLRGFLRAPSAPV